MIRKPFDFDIRLVSAISLVVFCGSPLSNLARAAGERGPVRVHPERFQPCLMPDGKVWGFSVRALAEGRLTIGAVVSEDQGQTWGNRRTLVELPRVVPPKTVWGDVVPLVDRNTGELHAFVLKWDQTDAKRPFPKLGLWHLKSPAPYRDWTTPKEIFDGYIGGLLSAIQHPNGTIVVPFAYMTSRTYSQSGPGMMAWTFMGQHTGTSVYSTDRGETFHRSNDVNVPASILLGIENGAIEPVCLPLKDGRLWMLMRTQLGRLWESFSADGIAWSSPRPSRFLASDSPACLARLRDGRIIAIWNCCQRYPYAYGGRQVLHAAISADDGRTWDGFREVMRDPNRLKPALPIRGDYGSGYPVAAPTADGKLIFATGQGATTGVYRLDPAWLLETEQRDDFGDGLESWSAYGTKGVELIADPVHKGSRSLRLERLDAELPAAAVWNFPNGRAGTVRIRCRRIPGMTETAITLTDHFSSPFDREADQNGLFTLSLGPSELLPDGKRTDGDAWHDLQLDWSFEKRRCVAKIDGKICKELPLLRLTSEGANYLRFRVLADGPAKGGMMVKSVEAQINRSAPGTGIDVPR